MSGITTCSACAFYVSRGEHEGVCRRNPPSSGNTGFQPPVRPNGGCGQGCAKYSERAIPPETGPVLDSQLTRLEKDYRNMVAEKNQEICKLRDLTVELNKTICQVRDQNAGQCQEIVAGNLQLERLQEKWDKKEKECQEWAKQNSEMGADITSCHRRVAELLRELADVKNANMVLKAAYDRREQEYWDLHKMHRADCDRWAKAHPEDKTPEGLYTTLVLCPVCGAEMDRLTHPKKEMHAQGVAMICGDERQEHRKASPACAQDARWTKGWILVPLGKPEAKP